MRVDVDINEYSSISFDIFDTLIKRCVSKPNDVFALVERYCKENEISIPDRFIEKRIVA